MWTEAPGSIKDTFGHLLELWGAMETEITQVNNVCGKEGPLSSVLAELLGHPQLFWNSYLIVMGATATSRELAADPRSFVQQRWVVVMSSTNHSDS